MSLALATCPFSWKHQATQHLQWLKSGPKTTQPNCLTGQFYLFFTGEKTRMADGSLKLRVLTSYIQFQVIYNLLLKCWGDVWLSVVLFLFLFLIFLNPQKYQIKLRLLVAELLIFWQYFRVYSIGQLYSWSLILYGTSSDPLKSTKGISTQILSS